MKAVLALSFVLILSGCTAVPVKQSFPEIPNSIKQPCAPLLEVSEGTTKLSDVLVVVTNNYALYHECQLKTETWLNWYNAQREIYGK